MVSAVMGSALVSVVVVDIVSQVVLVWVVSVTAQELGK
jgi:hypothetical protein